MTSETRLGLIAFGIATGLVLVPVVVILAARDRSPDHVKHNRTESKQEAGTGSKPAERSLFRSSKPSPDVEGENWNLEDMTNHFRKNGFDGWKGYSHKGEWAFANPIMSPAVAELTIERTGLMLQKNPGDIFVMCKYPTVQIAYQRLGSFGSKDCFQWGKWIVYCDPQLRSKIQSALN